MKQNQDNLEQLKKLARVFNTQNIISSADIEEVLLGITKIMNSFKKDNEVINKETKDIVESLLEQSVNSYNSLYKKVEDKIESANFDYKNDTGLIRDALNEHIKKVEKLSKSFKVLKLKNGKDGKDADEESIITSVLERIELPEYKENVADTGEQIIDKINEAPLTEDNKIDASRIKNLPQQNIVAGRNGITEAPKDNKTYGRRNRAWVEVTGGGGGSSAWGSITGTLSDQTDLQSALNAKQNSLGYTAENSANKSTSVTTDQASDTKYPSVKAVFDWASGAFTTTAAVASQITTALTGYATQAWVTSQGYITNVVTALGFTPENVANKSTSTSLGTSDTLYPSQNAVKTYVDTAVSGASGLTQPQVMARTLGC